MKKIISKKGAYFDFNNIVLFLVFVGLLSIIVIVPFINMHSSQQIADNDTGGLYFNNLSIGVTSTFNESSHWYCNAPILRNFALSFPSCYDNLNNTPIVNMQSPVLGRIAQESTDPVSNIFLKSIIIIIATLSALALLLLILKAISNV